jgi:hypothetical protein
MPKTSAGGTASPFRQVAKSLLQTEGLISSWLATVALVVMVTSQERKMMHIGN